MKRENSNENAAGRATAPLDDNEFLNFGLNRVAYIRPVQSNAQKMYSLHAADGTHLSTLESEQLATILAMHNELAPVTVH